MADLWLEAETFEDLGGWVIDQQSFAQIGSAYVMAHGQGIPVADAVTHARIETAGRYTVWVRTRDWTAVWKRGTPAGRFQVSINGTTLPEILGVNGPAWGWQKAGAVELPAGTCPVALHDLTGFNGRCDALYLTTDAAAVPPSDGAELAAFRRAKAGTVTQDDPETYDLIVAGGGIAGICTAIAALRSGLKVLLIQDRPVLGGCNSSEIRVSMGGFAHAEPYPRLGNVVQEIGPILGSGGTYDGSCYEDTRKYNVFRLSPADRYKVVLNERVIAVETAPGAARKITALITHNARTGTENRYRAPLFADCTGDAVVARMAGAEVMYGSDARSRFDESLAPEPATRQVMGMSVQWTTRKAAAPTPFPDIDWGIPFDEDKVYYIRGGDWEWETGQYRDQADDAEAIRDYGLMVTYANWSFLKNHARRKSEWACDTLDWVSSIGGKRESYRVVGDVILTQNDIENHVPYPDATGTMTWNIDLHYPDPENEAKFAEPFRSCAYHRGIQYPYPVPYRCLYARDVENLFLGGRHLSMSHVAFSCVRVMRTLGILGEVAGLAAAICIKENCLPRDVYGRHLDYLKAAMAQGIPVPCYHAYGVSVFESYHFKELGHIMIPFSAEQQADAALMQRIDKLGSPHLSH